MKAIQTFLILALTTTAIMAQNTLPPPTIDVTGEGIVRVVPDEVTINIRVENTGENTKTLKKQNDVTVNDVLKFLKKMNLNNVALTKIEDNPKKFKKVNFDANGNPTEENCP